MRAARIMSSLLSVSGLLDRRILVCRSLSLELLRAIWRPSRRAMVNTADRTRASAAPLSLAATRSLERPLPFLPITAGLPATPTSMGGDLWDEHGNVK